MSKELTEAVKLFISQPLNNPLSRGQIMEIAHIALSILEQQERGEGEWIEWGGGGLQSGLLSKAVTVKFADGFTHTGTAGHFYWGDNCSNPIIAYRIIPERATNQNGEQ